MTWEAERARRERIVVRVAEGQPLTKVAVDEGISRQRVSQIIHKHGLRLDRRNAERQTAIGVRNRREVDRLYAAGHSSLDIGEALGIHEGTVARHLRSLGYDRRPPMASHGSASRYGYHGCRCEPCLAGNNIRIKAWSNGLGKASVRARQIAYRRKHPDRQRAWLAVRAAVAKGTLAVPDRCPCGRNARLHAHHDDYARPLDVLWLCGVCHKARHKLRPTAA